MPDFFTKALQEETEVDRGYYSDIGEEKLMDYLQYNHYGLKFIMGFGSVLYGDPMSQFVNKVAKNLLVNQPKVLKYLQFFVLKTNYTNALCMEPGVIFITTGLLAQIENEAQLAYILAHEISHYKEKHFQRAYVETGAFHYSIMSHGRILFADAAKTMRAKFDAETGELEYEILKFEGDLKEKRNVI